MRGRVVTGEWRQVQRKSRPHWAILTLGDLDKINQEHQHLITQIQGQYPIAKEQGIENPNQKTADYSI